MIVRASTRNEAGLLGGASVETGVEVMIDGEEDAREAGRAAGRLLYVFTQGLGEGMTEANDEEES